MESPTPTRPYRTFWPLTLLLTACYLVLRLPNLRAMPAFFDETIYVRWAEIIAADPWHRLLVSMLDAKFPLHYWLLALGRPLASDPILAGRLLSVIFGALTIPFTLCLARELWQLHPTAKNTPTLFAALLGAILITNPFIAFNQRLAIAEPLLLLESILIAWLSLRLARGLVEAAPTRSLRNVALLLGIAWALTLLTKQNSSYALWILPPAALLAHAGPQVRRHFRRFLACYAIATLLGLALFLPVLFADSSTPLATRLFYKPVFQNHSTSSNWVIAGEHVATLLSPRSDAHPQWWPHDPAHPLDDGWFYLFLTPPLFFLTFCAIFYAVQRRQWRMLSFTAMWSAAQLVPLLAMAGVLFSRYTLIGFFPLLILPAWCLADLLPRCRAYLPRLVYPAIAALAIAFFLAWPTANAAWNAADWRAPILTRNDTLQFITRFSAGSATEQSIAWFNAAAQKHPITIITGNWAGHPNDLLYVAFSHNPNIQLLRGSFVDDPLHPAGPPNTFTLAGDFWQDRDAHPITLDPSRPTYFLSPARHDPNTGWFELVGLEKLPPGSRRVTLFRNGPAAGPTDDFAELHLYQIGLQLPPNSLAQQ